MGQCGWRGALRSAQDGKQKAKSNRGLSDRDSQGAGDDEVCGQVSLFPVLLRQLLSGLEGEVKDISG